MTPNVVTQREIFVARQPIFDRQMAVYGYELLFRSRNTSKYDGKDGDAATSSLLNSTLNIIGLDELTGGRKAFINVTGSILRSDLIQILPRQNVVIELLESVPPEQSVVDACKRVKEAGYLVALDDFVFQPGYEKLIALADILKVDFLISQAAERHDLVRRYSRPGLLFLAEKVESRQDYQMALELGYSYFQGYFFCKPSTVTAKELPSSKLYAMLLLKELREVTLNFEKIEQIIKHDVSLSYKLLRYLNSAAMGFGQKITSIRHALTLLGEEPLKRWGSFVAISGMNSDKPTELAVICLIRARFCELMSEPLNLAERSLDLFVMGLMSALDAMLDMPMNQALKQSPIGQDVRRALLGSTDTLGQLHQLTLACERGSWIAVNAIARRMGLNEDLVAHTYRNAMLWANESILD